MTMYCFVHEDTQLIFHEATPNIKATYSCPIKDCIHYHGLLCPYCNEAHGYPLDVCKAEWADTRNFIRQAIQPGVWPEYGVDYGPGISPKE